MRFLVPKDVLCIFRRNKRMEINRLKRILAYSQRMQETVQSQVKQFCHFTGMESDKEVLNILQIVRSALKKKNYLIFEMPFVDEEVGALSYKGDAQGYIIINSSLPKVNANFAVCHEAYHVFYQENEFRSKAEFGNEAYYEYEKEFAANLFAGMLMMPETGFRVMYDVFKKEAKGKEKETILRLMNYYQSPYMAVLIRCYELGLPESDTISAELLSMNSAEIKKCCNELWLDESILEASRRDDFPKMKKMVEDIGAEYVRESYINERTLNKVLQNMTTLYSKIKGE